MGEARQMGTEDVNVGTGKIKSIPINKMERCCNMCKGTGLIRPKPKEPRGGSTAILLSPGLSATAPKIVKGRKKK